MSDSAKKQQEEKSVEDIQKTCEEYLNGWKRAKADLLNFQKEEEKRISRAIDFANESFAKDVLGVLDSFEIAARSMSKNEEAAKGFLLIKNQLEEALRRHDIVRIEAKKGQEPDLHLHEVVREVELDAKDPAQADLDGKIVEEILPGYKIKSKVLRAAKISVGKKNQK